MCMDWSIRGDLQRPEHGRICIGAWGDLHRPSMGRVGQNRVLESLIGYYTV